MKIHELKILPEYFEDVAKEIKTFEIRKMIEILMWVIFLF